MSNTEPMFCPFIQVATIPVPNRMGQGVDIQQFGPHAQFYKPSHLDTNPKVWLPNECLGSRCMMWDSSSLGCSLNKSIYGNPIPLVNTDGAC